VQALTTKALTRAYYGKAQKYAYWDGQSMGGRQGYKLVQKYPTDYDGYLIGAPAINTTRMQLNHVYPQVVMQNDLGYILPALKTNFLSAQAVKSCDSLGLGLLLDPLSCRYDATKDSAALCSGVAGNGGIIGTNTNTGACVNLAEATALNKVWYGWTRDGSVPDPAVSNGMGTSLASNQLWYGLTHGTNLTGINAAGVLPSGSALAVVNAFGPVTLGTDLLALVLEDPSYGYTNFTNATGNGQSKYLTLTYPAFANAYDKGLQMNELVFSNLNTDNPDLAAARDSGRKVLHYHGLADEVIAPMGSINYYTRVAAVMGGIPEVQKFDRLFMIPGYAHDSTFSRSGQIDPTTLATDVNKVPLPQGATGRDELFVALMNWVENGAAPSRIEVSSANNSIAWPICMYPTKAAYNGTGDVKSAASYTCK
jgi:feruloyl esterase